LEDFTGLLRDKKKIRFLGYESLFYWSFPNPFGEAFRTYPSLPLSFITIVLHLCALTSLLEILKIFTSILLEEGN
jgi:hypothetical protein